MTNHSVITVGKEEEPITDMPSAAVIELYCELQSVGIHIWIDGGWGVDALLGNHTRSHKDLDIAIEQKDLPKFRELLATRGYQEIKLEIARPYNFVLSNDKGHEVDVHVISLDNQGNGIYGPVENGLMYPAASLTGNGVIDGQPVRCISPEWMVKFHSGYELKDKDFRDVSALCEKFGIELPDEYVHFQKSN